MPGMRPCDSIAIRRACACAAGAGGGGTDCVTDRPAPSADDRMLHRYLRARGGDVTKAKTMLLASLEWRKVELRTARVALCGVVWRCVAVGCSADRLPIARF